MKKLSKQAKIKWKNRISENHSLKNIQDLI